jgi:PTH1 family peptidyl-tRNA hydrolase
MVRLIVGLGNPGTKYRHTPHNVGFGVLDILASRHRGDFHASRRFRADVAAVTIADREVILLAPTTYMNLSGEAAAPFARYRAIEPAEMLVVCDDVALPMGRIRLRRKGSAGGHKGLTSIIQHLGTNEFPRLRIGIDSGERVDDLTDYVLRPWWGERREAMGRVCERAADAVERLLEIGFAKTASEFNGRDLLASDDAQTNSP